MMSIPLQQIVNNPFLLYQMIINLIVGLCVSAILIAVGIDFLEFQSRKNVIKEKKSIVETGSMISFFVVFYIFIRLHIGAIQTETLIRYILSGIGVCVVVLGCVVNIKGRLSLGNNWANQIKIYDDHTLVQTGVYRIIRHPLYASLIWMFYGTSLIHLNVSAFLVNTMVFLPFMYYRASQEEELLVKQFPEYQVYRLVTGMFFPKISIRRQKNAGM